MTKLLNKQKRFKIKPTHEIVSSVLNPSRFLGSKIDAKKACFSDFVCRSNDEDFNRAINIILRDEEISNALNQNVKSIKEAFSRTIVSANNVSNARIIKLYNAILLSKIDSLRLYVDAKQKVEELFVHGDLSQAINILDELNENLGFSIWEMEVRFAIYTIRKEYSAITEYLEKIKGETDDEFLRDIARVIAWKSQSVDPSLIMETMVRRPNKEFIDGNAFIIAAFYSLTCLHYPLYNDVDLMHSMKWLQLLPTIDLFNAVKKITVYGMGNGCLSEIEKNSLRDLFVSLNKELNLRDLREIVTAISSENSAQSILPITDDIILNYSEGNYEYVIDAVETRLNSLDDIITKINIFAKSYIHSNRKPNGLPIFLNEVINNLISIYSLKDANQAIMQQVGLIVKYSVLDVSDHLMISVLKSAPYFLSAQQKDGIIFKSKFLEKQLTPLACHLDESPSLYENYSLDLNVEHLIRKRTAIFSVLNNDEKMLDKVKDYYEVAPIKKDAIELMVECFIRCSDKKSLIEYASNELIINPNSNICLPLKDIVGYVSENNLYTIDSVICSYYYNKFSSEDNSSVLNEVFEEYIISRDVFRPSELVTGELSKKEIILLNEISKIDVMDYLGCFDNDNDLKIERIKILNKLVSAGFLSQTNVDGECKMIVDDILIENEAAKFNDAKIYIDTRSILNKRKNDIESLLHKYKNSLEEDQVNDNVQYEIESMAILKGSKNEILTRMMNILLVEYFNNKEVGLDKNLSSEIRHGFFGNLICSGPQNRHLLTELDGSGKYKSNQYWLEYYKMISSEILNKVDALLVKFSEDFNQIIEKAEQWMKVSLNSDDTDRVFVFNFTVEEFNMIRDLADASVSVDEITNSMFHLFNEKLLSCLDTMKSKLNEVFASQVDDLFTDLIDNINAAKSTTGMNYLLEEIRLANTEVKENIRTVCEWFSLKKSVDFESIELDKLIRLAERCFKQINSCDIEIHVESHLNHKIDGGQLYALVFCILNCFNNSYKYSSENRDIYVEITGEESKCFSIKILNEISNSTLQYLQNGGIDLLISKLADADNNDLLTKEGGSGLYKSLHGLKTVSSKYNLQPMIVNDKFCVEVTYGY